MNAKKFYLLIGILLIVGLLPQGNASADMGPKPTMDFEFVQEVPGSALTMVSWSLINCENSDCTTSGEIIPIEHGFDCSDNHCNAVVYGWYKYFQMEITFSDGVTRKSNVFKQRFFDARYRVTIRNDSLLAKELKGSNANRNIIGLVYAGGFFVYPVTILVIIIASIAVVASGVTKKREAREILKRLGKVILWGLIVDLVFTGLLLDAVTFILTICIEFILALLYWWYLKLPDRKILYGVLVANVFTQPLLVLLQTAFSPVAWLTMTNILGLELVVWLVEAPIVYFLQKGQLPFARILILTFVLNAASFGIGLLLPI